MANFQETANFIWQVADDILRGAFKPHEYGDVILPFVVLRRLDGVLEPVKDRVIAIYAQFKDHLDEDGVHPVLLQAAQGRQFYNTSLYDLRRLAQDANNIELNFKAYINGFSKNVRSMIEHFQIDKIVGKLSRNNLLFMLVSKFTEVNLNPSEVSNHEMGLIFEHVIYKFYEMSNETAGEHYTPREVIRLMVNLLFAEQSEELQGKGLVRSVFDPACGTGGMLTIAKAHIQEQINPNVEIVLYGQEINEQTYAIAKSDVLIMGENAENIKLGSSFSQDGFVGRQFDYMLSNPPFGVSWKKEEAFIKNDPQQRFHAGLPRSSDGALLFLQHKISKMQARGSRIAIVFNGSPLFTGDAGSGESDIRKWIIENDWLEAIVALPTDLFYNTGIATYIWLVTNKKPAHRVGKVQLINATGFCKNMRKSLGSKRHYISAEQIAEISAIYTGFETGPYCKIYDNDDFGFTKVTVERLLLENGKIVTDSKGQPKADSKLRDYEKIPLKEDIDAYFEREVKPHVPDAWLDRSKDKVGYEINFTKYFYQYTPLEPLERIKADILRLEAETEGLLQEILT
ncbi:N-6 DNA methylase [Candidatus Vecturithrix granuli]|uniref:site-specific DNA-methyltransferase (adenine-specific) n=1 Tax=Vecturithrix granuli TaxID=1499967 RepID=A0A081C8C1_VECG1|nr:N-6 DNA methylase [Candidatus Vecturithrix granuli]